MAAKIKLQRKGTKNRPFYRVVIQDESAAPCSNVVDVIGIYNPLQNPPIFSVKKDETLAWIKKGAKPTDKVRILLGKAGILPPIDLTKLNKRKPKNAPAEEKPAEAAPAAAATEAAPEAAAPAAEPQA
ncbi:MAG: 30S ribosomal protein S16 [Candidatus Margulisiibacteriota bacterium]